MPATILAHQAVVLPLKLWRPRRISGLALCLGSAAPDLEFIFRMTDDWLFSHTFPAQLYFTVPVTLVLVWLLGAVLIPFLLPYLPPAQRRALAGLASIKPPRTPGEWNTVALCALIGGLSHVFVDGFTHGNHSGWAVAFLPVLRTSVAFPFGNVPLYDVFQHGLTVVFALLALRWLHLIRVQFSASSPALAIQGRTRAEGVLLVATLAVAALLGALAGAALREADGGMTLLAGIAFGAINAVFATSLLLAALDERTRRLTVQDQKPEVYCAPGTVH